MASKMFWTDAAQAEQRLVGSYVMYDQDVVYIERIREGEYSLAENKYGTPKASFISSATGKTTSKPLDDPKFHNFRKLPRLGWVNVEIGETVQSFFLERQARNMQSHGLNSSNTFIYHFQNGVLTPSRSFVVAQILGHKNFNELQGEDISKLYPPLEEILRVIKDGDTLAYSPSFAVHMCADGIRWLYRNKERIGLFPGINTLSLFPRKSFYREEIMEDPCFTLTEIREF